jgi:hypothetical protein
MKRLDVLFWACMVGASVDLAGFVFASRVLFSPQLATLFLGSALAFAVGATAYWLSDRSTE